MQQELYQSSLDNLPLFIDCGNPIRSDSMLFNSIVVDISTVHAEKRRKNSDVDMELNDIEKSNMTNSSKTERIVSERNKDIEWFPDDQESKEIIEQEEHEDEDEYEYEEEEEEEQDNDRDMADHEMGLSYLDRSYSASSIESSVDDSIISCESDPNNKNESTNEIVQECANDNTCIDSKDISIDSSKLSPPWPNLFDMQSLEDNIGIFGKNMINNCEGGCAMWYHLVNYLTYVHGKEQLHPNSLHIAVQYCAILAGRGSVRFQWENMEWIALLALFVAAKFEDGVQLDPERLLTYTNKSYPKTSIVDWESSFCEKLHYRLWMTSRLGYALETLKLVKINTELYNVNNSKTTEESENNISEHWKAVEYKSGEKNDNITTEDLRLICMTQFLCEISLYESFFYNYNHSHVGIACVYTAFYLCGRPLTPEIEKKLSYDRSKLLPLIQRLVQVARMSSNITNQEEHSFNRKNQTYIKYSSTLFAEVSKLPLKPTSILQHSTPTPEQKQK